MTGTTPRSLRWYEKLGLLPSAKRTGGRLRLYTEQDIALIKKIKQYQKSGYSLQEIKKNLLKSSQPLKLQNKTKIFLESTFSIPYGEISSPDFEIIPMNIELGFYKYKDFTAMTPGILAEVEKKKRKPAKTSAPAIAEYAAVFTKAFAAGYTEIISLHADQRISGAYANALAAAGRLAGLPIKVIDTGFLALGFFYVYQEFLKAQKLNSKIIRQIISKMQNRVTEIFILNSLERLGLDKLNPLSRSILSCVPILQHTAEHGLLPIARANNLREAVNYISKQLKPAAEKILGYSDNNILHKAELRVAKKYLYSTAVTANLSRSLIGVAVKF